MNAEEIAKFIVREQQRWPIAEGALAASVAGALLAAIEALETIVLDEEEYEPSDQHAALLLAREALAKIRSGQ